MISETPGLVLDVVVAAPPGRAGDLERAVRRLRADLDRRFPAQQTRITIASDAETSETAERLSRRFGGVRVVRLEPSSRRPGLRTAALGDSARFVAAAASLPASGIAVDGWPPWGARREGE